MGDKPTHAVSHGTTFLVAPVSQRFVTYACSACVRVATIGRTRRGCRGGAGERAQKLHKGALDACCPTRWQDAGDSSAVALFRAGQRLWGPANLPSGSVPHCCAQPRGWGGRTPFDTASFTSPMRHKLACREQGAVSHHTCLAWPKLTKHSTLSSPRLLRTSRVEPACRPCTYARKHALHVEHTVGKALAH